MIFELSVNSSFTPENTANNNDCITTISVIMCRYNNETGAGSVANDLIAISYNMKQDADIDKKRR